MTKRLAGAVVALGFACCVWASQVDAMDCKAIQDAYASAIKQAQFCDRVTSGDPNHPMVTVNLIGRGMKK